MPAGDAARQPCCASGGLITLPTLVTADQLTCLALVRLALLASWGTLSPLACRRASYLAKLPTAFSISDNPGLAP